MKHLFVMMPAQSPEPNTVIYISKLLNSGQPILVSTLV